MNNTPRTTPINIQALYKMSREELLELCENDLEILKICNEDPILNRKITAPKTLF